MNSSLIVLITIIHVVVSDYGTKIQCASSNTSTVNWASCGGENSKQITVFDSDGYGYGTDGAKGHWKFSIIMCYDNSIDSSKQYIVDIKAINGASTCSSGYTRACYFDTTSHDINGVKGR